MTPHQRQILASLDREAKIAAAKAYRAGWRRGGDREGYPAAVAALVEHGLDLEDARVAAPYVIHAAATLARTRLVLAAVRYASTGWPVSSRMISDHARTVRVLAAGVGMKPFSASFAAVPGVMSIPAKWIRA